MLLLSRWDKMARCKSPAIAVLTADPATQEAIHLVVKFSAGPRRNKVLPISAPAAK